MASSGEEIRNYRVKKLELLKKAGTNPYPAKLPFAVSELVFIKKNFKKLASSKKLLGVAGRILAKREHGGSAFLDIFDGTGNLPAGKAGLQIFLREDKVGKNAYKLFLETADIGDFVAVSGKAFYTKRKEPTIEAARWEMLAKSLLPMPEKWHGLQDIEERFRKRYLDLLMNSSVKERFLFRSRLIYKLRSLLDKEGFVEVETPVLQTMAGGASAQPFKTRHNALDIDLWLRIATEIHLKYLLIGGFNKVYEIGRIFRNEGIDATHNPEFTTLELYIAYSDHENLMKFAEKLLGDLAVLAAKNKIITFGGQKISFKAPFKKITFIEALERHALITDYPKKSRGDLVTFAMRFGVNPESHESKDKIAEKIFAKVCRPKFIQPTFVVDYPASTLPLAKRSPKNPEAVLSFQVVAGGIEIVKAFNELNDPIDQRERLKKEAAVGAEGDAEAQPLDEEFIEALEYGMPPAAGLGIGLDRLVMLFTDTDNIKEVILFPTMKPK